MMFLVRDPVPGNGVRANVDRAAGRALADSCPEAACAVLDGLFAPDVDACNAHVVHDNQAPTAGYDERQVKSEAGAIGFPRTLG